MKKLRSSLAAKAAAVLLLLVFLTTCALSVFGAVILFEYNAYAGGTELEAAMLSTQADRTAAELESMFDLYGDESAWKEQLELYRTRYAPENSNLCISVTVDGKSVFENRSFADYRADTFETRECSFVETDKTETITREFADKQAFEDYLENSGRIVHDYTIVEKGNGSLRVTLELEKPVKHTAVIRTAVLASLTADDSILRTSQHVQRLLTLRDWLIPIAVVSLLLCAALFVFLLASAGHKAGVEGIHLNWVDHIPLDLYAAVLLAGFIATAEALEASRWHFGQVSGVLLLIAACVIWALLWLSPILSFAARAKAGKWWRNTICFYLLRGLWRLTKRVWRGVRYICRNLPLYWKTLLLCLGLTLVELLCLAARTYPALWVAEKLLLTPLLVLVVIHFRKLQACAERIASGDLDARVSVRHMLPELRKHGESLNSIGVGLQRAVEVQMRSERMKAELITNVSHDIKTPLTSIVSYVDLLQKEGLTSPNAPEYLAVLERQSARLKKLTTDLVEASKASTGNVTVQLERTDANVLLAQAAGEYEEKLRAQQLEPVVSLYAAHPFVMADGRLLWRVMDNLLSNICKYAQPHTRVYLQSDVSDGMLEISFKNVSREPLNIPAEELMERFVRGDAARSTEGSGLGLSIARSLTELQNGTFAVSIDGDLFKASLRFPLC